MNKLLIKLIKSPIHYLYSGEKYLKKRSKELEIYYNDPKTDLAINDVIICMFDGKMAHGGLADRLRGIISMYHYSKLNNLNFRIHHTHPFNLAYFLQPNLYDWEIKESEISYNKELSIPLYIACGNYYFEDSFTKKILDKNIKGYKQYHVYPSLKIADDKFHELFHELFTPSPILQNAINNLLNDINGKFITMSFRFVELLGDFKDSINITLTSEERILLINKCLNAIGEIRKKAPSHDKVIITSDSTTFLEYAKSLPDVYIIPGKIGHIDYQDDINIHLKTFTDFLIISHAEKAYMVRTPIMYKSGFAQRACMINNTPFEEYIIKE